MAGTAPFGPRERRMKSSCFEMVCVDGAASASAPAFDDRRLKRSKLLALRTGLPARGVPRGESSPLSPPRGVAGEPGVRAAFDRRFPHWNDRRNRPCLRARSLRASARARWPRL